MSLETLNKDLFEILAAKVHFNDIIALSRVSKTVRKKLMSCVGAWKCISFALLPVTERTLSSSLEESWNVNDAMVYMVEFLTNNNLLSFVQEVSFGEKRPVDLAVLAMLSSLKTLRLNCSSIVNAHGFWCLSQLRNLQVLELSNSSSVLRSFPVEAFSSGCLRDLSLFGFSFSLSAELEHVKMLEVLRLEKCNVSGNLDLLLQCGNLRRLSLWGSRFEGSLHVVSKLTKLRDLNIGGLDQTNNEVLESISVGSLLKLKTLTISMCGNVSDRGLMALLRLRPKLQTVHHTSCGSICAPWLSII